MKEKVTLNVEEQKRLLVLNQILAERMTGQEAAEGAARSLHPEYPGELDAPLWLIGRSWCRYAAPKCGECRMRDVCEKVGVS